MELTNQENIGPIRINAEASERLGGNWKTKLFEEIGGDYVVKVDHRVQEETKRNADESDAEYYSKRYAASVSFVQRQKANSDPVRNYIPEGIKTPQEFHLIIDGEDGFPIPIRVQEKVEGKMIRDIDLHDLSDKNRDLLKQLVDSSIKYFLSTGKIIDLAGSYGKEDKKISFATLARWLIDSATKPIEKSSNIFINKDNILVMVDLNTSFPGDDLANKVGKFILFSGLMGTKLAEKLKLRSKK